MRPRETLFYPGGSTGVALAPRLRHPLRKRESGGEADERSVIPCPTTKHECTSAPRDPSIHMPDDLAMRASRRARRPEHGQVTVTTPWT